MCCHCTDVQMRFPVLILWPVTQLAKSPGPACPPSGCRRRQPHGVPCAPGSHPSFSEPRPGPWTPHLTVANVCFSRRGQRGPSELPAGLGLLALDPFHQAGTVLRSLSLLQGVVVCFQAFEDVDCRQTHVPHLCKRSHRLLISL